MHDLIDLQLYPLDNPDSAGLQSLVRMSRAALDQNGMFSLDGFLRAGVAERIVGELQANLATQSFTHKRSHNIYFKKTIPELDPSHPAMVQVETVSHTLCADQIAHSVLTAVYEFEPLHRFLATTMGKTALHPMQDPLARLNVMGYRAGEALNWHFDRSEFTTTLLLQAPDDGGAFEYRTDLRSDDDPNYDGVARLLNGADPHVKSLRLRAGTLNVFRGKNTAHRVTPVEGARERIVSVFSYYERPGVQFSDDERIGFYGRAA